MSIFGRIGAGIKAIAQKAGSSFGRIFGRIEPAPPPPLEAQPPELPEYASAEVRALKRAMDILIESEQYPGDPTYEQARKEALIYINKSQALRDKGAKQTGNRRDIANRYINSQLSSKQGIETRKAHKLEVFNYNFGFNLSQPQADVVGQLMKSSSFKKLMETYKEKYDIIIGMLGDEVEAGTDPIRLEQQLDLWQAAGIEPEFDIFSKVSELPSDEFQQMRMQILEYIEENAHADEYEMRNDIEGIIGGFINW